MLRTTKAYTQPEFKYGKRTDMPCLQAFPAAHFQ